MKIGILYPRSNTHPGIMFEFMDGIKTALKQKQLNDHIRLISESIGFGGNEKEVYEKAEKLLLLEGTDILVAYVDLRVLEILNPLLYKGAVTRYINQIIRFLEAGKLTTGTVEEKTAGYITAIEEKSMIISTINNEAIRVTLIYTDEGFLNGSYLIRLGTAVDGKSSH